MVNRRLLNVMFFSLLLFGSACHVVKKSVPTQTVAVQTPKSSPDPTTAPTATMSPAPTLTSIASPTVTEIPPTTLPTQTPIPTKTIPPFLSPDLVKIDPLNADRLQIVATLPASGASVVAYSPDGLWLAAGLFNSNTVKIWEISSGRELMTLNGHVNSRIISYLAFSPDGHQIASSSQGWEAANDNLVLWDTNNGQELNVYKGFLGAVSPDWKILALTRREQSGGAYLQLIDIESGKEIHALKALSDIYGISFSPLSQVVVGKMYGVFQDLFTFWYIASGKERNTLYDWKEFSFSADGQTIAALLENQQDEEKGELNIFEANSLKWVKTLGKGADALWYTVRAFSPDNQILAASFGDHISLWETKTWRKLASFSVPAPVGLVFSPDGRILASFSQHEPVRFWGVLP